VISDFKEEKWRSMDLVSEMLVSQLSDSSSIRAMQICPKFRGRATRLSIVRSQNSFGMIDRLLNRYWDYPRWLKQQTQGFDLFHVVDHSYAHLVNVLPAKRTIVTCHDLDAFRVLWQESRTGAAWILRPLFQRTLLGLQNAAMVTCDSVSVREQMLEHRLLPPDRIKVIPIGVHPVCSPIEGPADRELTTLIGPQSKELAEFVHVGSTIPRKRIDVLLRVLARLRAAADQPQARLLRIGAEFTAAQNRMIKELQIADRIVCLPSLSWLLLAAAYRRADLCLQTSDAEGFGLPIAEAMACGTPVVASDLDVLRETGGDAATYCAVAEVEEWAARITSLLREKKENPAGWESRRERSLAQAAKFSWKNFAHQMAELYLEVSAAAQFQGAPLRTPS
jgi:glycosyltransferase involved in cell wall biosynthesis